VLRRLGRAGAQKLLGVLITVGEAVASSAPATRC